jgi:hypothetical protein
MIEVQFDVDDGNGGTTQRTVAITINGLNDAPVAIPDLVYTEIATPIGIEVLRNDFDPDASDASNLSPVLGAVAPANGTVALGPNNTIVYTPNAAFLGNDSFSYFITDGDLNSSEVLVDVEVAPDNNPPNANQPINATFSENAGIQNVNVVGNATSTDVPPDTLFATNFTVTSGDGSGLTFDPLTSTVRVETGTYSYLGAGDSEPIRFTFTLNDGRGNRRPGSGTITIIGANDNHDRHRGCCIPDRTRPSQRNVYRQRE